MAISYEKCTAYISWITCIVIMIAIGSYNTEKAELKTIMILIDFFAFMYSTKWTYNCK